MLQISYLNKFTDDCTRMEKELNLDFGCPERKVLKISFRIVFVVEMCLITYNITQFN